MKDRDAHAYAVEVLQANRGSEAGTFLAHLQDDQRFDEPAFWDYCNAIATLAELTEHAAQLDRVISRAIFWTYQHTLVLVLRHHLPGDDYQIIDLPSTFLHLYVARLRGAVDSYFGGATDDCEPGGSS